MKITCGIYLINKQNELLICHPTNHSDSTWTIPKGVFDVDDISYLNAAVRELHEETNIKLNFEDIVQDIPISLGSIKYKKSNKALVGFYAKLKINHNLFDLKCNSFFDIYDKKIPEVDDYKWVPIDDAYNLIHETQVTLLKDYLK